LNLLRHFQRKTASNNFIPEIDGLRFLAIITVLLYHLNTAFSKEIGLGLPNALIEMGGSKSDFSLAWFWVRLDLGVKVFFAISGFVLALPFLKYYMGLSDKKVKLKTYFIRRLTRLEPPFIITLVFFYLVHVFLLNEDALVFLQHLGAGLIYGHVFIFGTANPINPVTWSLETEAQFYVIIPFIMWLIFKVKNSVSSILLLLGLIVGSMFFRNEFVFSPHWGQSIFAYIINFSMGIIVCWTYLTFPKWFKGRLGFYDIIGLIGTLGLFYFYKPQHYIGSQIYFNISIAVVMITAFKGNMLNWFYTRPLVYMIGGMCYSIYLIHYAFLHLSVKLTKLLWIEGNSYTCNLGIQVLVGVPLVLLVSAVFFRYFERPFMDKDWLAKLKSYFAGISEWFKDLK
jgi:peptidoglycan/LPS O-acetylase OafA/YrhL